MDQGVTVPVTSSHSPLCWLHEGLRAVHAACCHTVSISPPGALLPLSKEPTPPDLLLPETCSTIYAVGKVLKAQRADFSGAFI